MRSARHGSVAAQRPYMQVDEESEANMTKALGISLQSKEDGDKKPAAKGEVAEGGI